MIEQLNYSYFTVEQIKKSVGKEKAVVFQPLGSGAKLNGEFLIDESGRSIELNDIITNNVNIEENEIIVPANNITFLNDDKEVKETKSIII